ncbi:unnamed protein product [Allacma fusca]|uniref:Uncharacterized protein n=1 Tax=Allacma fusca TaxID=39272 RepID=A0A8J2JMA4_9HEXA|nr:unnamed protein product [Allacma fusca]
MSKGNMISAGVFITPKILFYIRKSLEIGNYFGLHPWTWNRTSGKAEIGPWSQQIKWRLNISLTIPFLTFSLFRCQQFIRGGDCTSVEKIHLQFVAALYVMTLAFHWNVFRSQDDAINYINRAIHWAQYLDETFVENRGNRIPLLTKIMEIMLQLSFCVLTYFAPFSFVTIVIFQPRSPDQLGSLFLRGFEVELQTMLIIIFLSTCISLHTILLLSANATAFLASALAGGLPVLLTALELSHRSSKYTTGHLRGRMIKLQIYQAVRIVMIFWNGVFGAVIIPVLQLLSSFLIVIGFCGAIRMEGFQSLALAFGSCCLLTFVVVGFSILAEIDLRSSQLIYEWTSEEFAENCSKWFQCKVKSLPPLKCVIGSMFFVDKPMILTLVGSLVDNTVTFLIMNS